MSTDPRHDPDDVDARFAELIEGNFGERVRTQTRPVVASSLLEAWDAADRVADADESRPEPLPPMARWSLLASLGTALGLMGVVLAILAWFGVEMASWVSWFGAGSAVVGLALLLLAALRRKDPRDPFDDGARL